MLLAIFYRFRYVAMTYLRREKDEILTRHITDALNPPDDNWGGKALAAALKSHRTRLSRELSDHNVSSFADRWQLKPDATSLNIVLLGADGLSQELANEITVIQFCCIVLLFFCISTSWPVSTA